MQIKTKVRYDLSAEHNLSWRDWETGKSPHEITSLLLGEGTEEYWQDSPHEITTLLLGTYT